MKGMDMGRACQLFLIGAVFAAALWFAPTQASAAKCHFSKNEKIAMVSWVMLIPGAVITGLACKRDLFNQGRNRERALPTENRSRTEFRIIDRRRRRAI